MSIYFWRSIGRPVHCAHIVMSSSIPDLRALHSSPLSRDGSGPYNSSESYRRLLTSVFAPVPNSECSKLCNTQYIPAAVATAYDESLSPEQPISARAQLSGICCRAFLPCQARAAPSHRVPWMASASGKVMPEASSNTSSPYFEGKIKTSFRPCCFKTWSGIFDGSRNVASPRGSVYG